MIPNSKEPSESPEAALIENFEARLLPLFLSQSKSEVGEVAFGDDTLNENSSGNVFSRCVSRAAMFGNIGIAGKTSCGKLVVLDASCRGESMRDEF